MSQEKVSELISHIMTALSGCALYAEQHPVFGEFAEKALRVLEELYEEGSVSIVMIGDSLIVNDKPFLDRGVYVSNFFKRLRKKKIEKIILRKGLDISEFRKFISVMASRDDITSSPNISVGIIEVRLKTAGADISALLDKGISRVRETFNGLSRFRRLDTVSLEDAVMDFISTLKKEMNVLRLVSPVKSYNEYTYIHATNVSVLALFQAESMGLRGEDLHDIGLAGLLHDVGKMFVPTSVLDKQTKLTQEEWVEMKKHPVHGAMYLSKLPDVPPLAPIVAFEHHMKFDGSGYPETKKFGRNQHLVSQMVTIADFFDALRTDRPYRKALDVPTIAGMMKGASGKDFNPELVEIFLCSLARVSNSL